MSLDTQTFGITRYWLAVALAEIPRTGDIFGSAQLGRARKAFLAGANQLKAIRNWLTNAELVKSNGRQVQLSDLGRLVAAKDPQARQPWTWWLFHLHLCANGDSFPYSAFFATFDSEGASWSTQDEIVTALWESAREGGNVIEKSSVETYFAGIENSLRPNSPLYGLGLIERRLDNDGGSRLRRRLSRPPAIAVAYTALLLHRRHFANQPTVEMRWLLQKGLGRFLGLRDSDVREEVGLINNDASLARFIQYRRAVNLDSVQFTDSSDALLMKVASKAYTQGDILWQ